jgi:pimeloyl-ACP methyl ester carboxylesterase
VTKAKRSHLDDLRGAGRLAIQATTSVTALVEEMHRTIASGPDILGRPLEGPVRLITAAVYGSIRGVTSLVGAGLDVALAQLEPLLSPLLGSAPSLPERELLLAVLNGVLGDYLAQTQNSLAIEMTFRQGGQALTLERDALNRALPEARGKLLVLVHGSCLNDLAWKHKAHDHGEALARDLGYTPIYLHYNSGLHISENGRAFADLLDQLVAYWPVPVEEIAIVCHSMGGLVARSACHAAEAASQAWRPKLNKLVCLASPHHGAPLERGGNLFELGLGVSRYSAPLATLGKLRSAGVTDLRFGNVLDEHWHGLDRFSRHPDTRDALTLPEGVQCYALAATLSTTLSGKLRGDGLVPVDSALGRHKKAALTLAFPEAHQFIALGTGHVEVLSRPEVYATLKQWLAA